MIKKYVAYILLVISWPVSLIHRIWTNHKPDNKAWFLFKPEIEQDIQWYIADTGNMLAVLLVLLALYLYHKYLNVSHSDVPFLLKGLILMQVIEIFHYWLYFKQSDIVLILQGFILLTCILCILFKKRQANGETY
jgi:hypothetical protein